MGRRELKRLGRWYGRKKEESMGTSGGGIFEASVEGNCERGLLREVMP